MTTHLPGLVRFAYVLLGAWAACVALFGASAQWWPWPLEAITTVPTTALCLAAAMRPRLHLLVWASSIAAVWAMIQACRVQAADYSWEALLVASTTYALVGILAATLGVFVVFVASLTAVSERAER